MVAFLSEGRHFKGAPQPFQGVVAPNCPPWIRHCLEAMLRKNVYLFLERCGKFNNVWLRAVMQSGCLYSSSGAELGGPGPQILPGPPVAPPKFFRSLSESPTQTIDSSPCCKTGPSDSPPNENVWLRPCSSLFFEHYNRILLCTACSDIAMLIRFRASHDTTHSYFTWPQPV